MGPLDTVNAEYSDIQNKLNVNYYYEIKRSETFCTIHLASCVFECKIDSKNIWIEYNIVDMTQSNNSVFIRIKPRAQHVKWLGKCKFNVLSSAVLDLFSSIKYCIIVIILIWYSSYNENHRGLIIFIIFTQNVTTTH